MTREELFLKLKLAIDNEYEAYTMYSEMSDLSDDKELKIILSRIAKEEYDHWQTLLKRYKILEKLIR